MRARGLPLLVLAWIGFAGCMGGADDDSGDRSKHESHRSTPPGATHLPDGLPSPGATRPARVARLRLPGGEPSPGSRRVTIGTGGGEYTNHLPATLVIQLPRGWRVDRSTKLPGAVIPVQPGTAVAPRFDGSAPDVLLRGNGRIVAIGFCNLAFAGSLREPGLDDPSGDSLAMEAAGRRYLRHGSVERPEPPRLAPHVYRAVHMLTVAFPGGGCMYLADPVVPDPAQGEASATGSPEDLEKAVRAAARRPLPAHLVEIAKQTTAYWGDSPRLPASNLRAEAIARRAQRAVMDSPRLRYDERQSLCRDQGDCRETEADEARLVEREAATGYVFADVTDESQGSRLLLVRTRQSVRRSSDGRCWDEDFYGGAPYGGFLFHGLFSHGYDRAAFFPPLRRWRLSYEPPRPAGPATTELRWRSYFDRGRAVVENESLRILSMERVERAGPRTWTRRTVKFTYPASLKRVRAEPECRHETP